MTVEGLAAEAEIHWTYLSSIERGKHNPSWKVVCGLATALEAELSDIARLASKQPASRRRRSR